MERHSSNAMFISEIPVCYMSRTGDAEKTIQWIGNLNPRTTVRDIILSIFPACDSTNYALYIHTDRKKQLLNYSTRIYKIVAKMTEQKKSARRLLFEIRLKKRVRFADEILVQNIIQGQCISNEKMTRDLLEIVSTPLEKCGDKSKENSVKYSRRSSLKIINENIPYSSSESGISSNFSNADFLVPRKSKLETLV